MLHVKAFQSRAGGSKNFLVRQISGADIYVQNFAKPWCLQVCRLTNDIHYMLLFYIGIYVHLNWKISREINVTVSYNQYYSDIKPTCC